MFENLSIGHLLVVLVIFLLLFGAKRIPEIAGSLGQGINQFKRTMNDAGGALGATESAQPPVAARDSVPLSSPRMSDATGLAEHADVAREPKRLM